MTGLVPEITKIGTYAKGKTITQKDIDALREALEYRERKEGKSADK